MIIILKSLNTPRFISCGINSEIDCHTYLKIQKFSTKATQGAKVAIHPQFFELENIAESIFLKIIKTKPGV